MEQEYETRSFLGDLFNISNYSFFRGLARLYLGIYSTVFIVFLLISRFFYWEFFSRIFSTFTGTSLFALVFIVAFAFAIDIEVNFPKNYNYYKETTEYKYTIVSGIILIIVAMFIQYYLDIVTDHYEFQCGTYLVDIHQGIYHILGCDCETLGNTWDVVEMRGFELEQTTNCKLCEECECIVEDAIDTYESDRYYRR